MTEKNLHAQVLVVDDDEDIIEVLTTRLEAMGLDVFTASNGAEALTQISDHQPDLMLLDVQLPDMTGLELLSKFREEGEEITVIVITAHGSVENAVEAMRRGAYDFIPKPFDPKRIEVVVRKAVERSYLRRENIVLQESIESRQDGIIGSSPAITEVMETAKKAAQSRSTVLILGPSGTGKEVFARAIHQWSPRRRAPFVPINCVALPEDLLESELFGHEKGAFTGAGRLKKGKFELARGGTVFLDEIGHLKPSLQTKLLRVLQEGEFERVGGTRVLSADVRILAASNRNLEEAIQKGDFREDLYYRLNVIRIELPLLCDRKEDIIPLAEYFIRKYSAETKRQVEGLSEPVRDPMLAYHWPGNVRELENAIERAVVLGTEPLIEMEDLPAHIWESHSAPTAEGVSGFHHLIEEHKRKVIEEALVKCEGNQTRAAEMLGLQRTYLSRLMRTLGLRE